MNLPHTLWGMVYHNNNGDFRNITDKVYLMASVESNASAKKCCLTLLLHNYKIYEDALIAEDTKIKHQEFFDNIGFR
jgi:hypothetical protein